LPMGPDNYYLDIGCRSGDSHMLDYVLQAAQIEVVPGPKTPGFIVARNVGVRLPSVWTWLNLSGQ